jgi:transposase
MTDKKGNTPRKYTREFREGAVRLVLTDGSSVTTAADRLGIPMNTLSAWVIQARKQKGAFTPQADRDLAAKVRELEAENRKLRIEREILKKATAYFAKEQS